MPYFDAWLQNCLEKKDTVTLIARNEDDNEMLGIVIVELMTKDAEMTENTPLKGRANICPDKLDAIFTFLDWMKKDLDPSRDHGIEQWADVAILACNLDRRIPGLGTKLVEKATNMIIEEAGVKALTSIATSHYSGKIFQKLGFDVVQETTYDQYKVDGEIVFPTDQPHSHARLFLKRI